MRKYGIDYYFCSLFFLLQIWAIEYFGQGQFSFVRIVSCMSTAWMKIYDVILQWNCTHSGILFQWLISNPVLHWNWCFMTLEYFSTIMIVLIMNAMTSQCPKPMVQLVPQAISNTCWLRQLKEATPKFGLSCARAEFVLFIYLRYHSESNIKESHNFAHNT